MDSEKNGMLYNALRKRCWVIWAFKFGEIMLRRLSSSF
jgi:hypothetical protein